MQHMPFTLWLGTIAGATLVLGIVLIGVYKLLETHPVVGSAGGIALGAVPNYTEAMVGEMYFSPKLGELKLMIVAAAVGSMIGVVGTVSRFRPELRVESTVTKQ